MLWNSNLYLYILIHFGLETSPIALGYHSINSPLYKHLSDILGTKWTAEKILLTIATLLFSLNNFELNIRLINGSRNTPVKDQPMLSYITISNKARHIPVHDTYTLYQRKKIGTIRNVTALCARKDNHMFVANWQANKVKVNLISDFL